MNRLLNALVLLVLFLAPQAMASPVGTYVVEGTNPGDESAYSGTVQVDRTGDTYAVYWVVGGQEYVGTGIGAASVNNTMVMGQADDKDTALSVSYSSGASFGLAFFVEQPDGTWQGIWTYAGSERIGKEVWTPAD